MGSVHSCWPPVRFINWQNRSWIGGEVNRRTRTKSCLQQSKGDMRILLVGGTGTIGSAVAERLSGDHDVVVAGHTTGEVQVDLAESASIDRLYEATGPIDAVVSCAGEAAFGSLEELGDDDFALSLSNKLMGQVNLVRRGLNAVNEQGVFTLTSGVLSQEPIEGSAAISLVNAGLEGFVRAAALEMPNRLRVNVVSPPWVEETLEAMGADFSPSLPSATVAKAYQKSVEGTMNGAVINARSVA